MTETLSAILPADLEALIGECLELTASRGLVLATAESCTGGLISSVLTDVDGQGHVFDRGFVVYSAAAKEDLLGISSSTLKQEGAVSRVVALAMARGALERSDADIVLAVTGFAGPAGPDDEAGLVHLVCQSRKGEPEHREEHLGAIGRGEARIACLRIAIEMIMAMTVSLRPVQPE